MMENAFKLLLSCPSGLSSSQVSVRFDESYDRVPHPDAELEDSISESEPLLIGISRRVLNVRPTAFFFIKCNLQSTQVQELYFSAQDGYESTKLYTIHPSELENMASKMSGCHRGGFALYKLMLAGGNDLK